MSAGDCFRCHKAGHWAKDCPLKTNSKPIAVAEDAVAEDAATSPPAILCPWNGGTCNVFTSKTEKNPNRRFYKCSADPSCGFFKWCDQVNIKSEPISVHPTCPCGSGPCRRVTVIDGPKAHCSYFVCPINKSFGACGFFQWEDDVQVQPESEEVGETGLDSEGNVKRSRHGVVLVSDFNSTPCNEVVSGIAHSMKDCADARQMNAFNLGKESIQVCSKFNNLKLDSNGVFFPTDSRNQEPVTGLSQNTSYPVLNGTEKYEHQSTTAGDSRTSFSSSFSSMELIEQYNMEKRHFESVSLKHVDALAAFTGSCKQLEPLRDRAHSLRKQLLEVENQVKVNEAETSVLAMTLQEVSSELVKSQKTMAEMAGKVAKEVRIKQREFTAP